MCALRRGPLVTLSFRFMIVIFEGKSLLLFLFVFITQTSIKSITSSIANAYYIELINTKMHQQSF